LHNRPTCPILGCPFIVFPDPRPTMNSISNYPAQAYDYVYGNYGTVGLIVAGVGLVVAVISLMVWFDRARK
jgi:hypothetical protein